MFGERPVRNTVNLVGDGDDVDVVKDTEKAFGIEITDEEAEAIHTVGGLHDLVCSKIEFAPQSVCLSARAFRSLRDASFAEPRAVRPSTRIADLRQGLSEHRWCRTMSKRSGLDFEVGEAHMLFGWLFLALFFAPFGILVIWSKESLLWSLSSFLLWLLLPLFRYAPARLSRRTETAAELVRRSMGRNYARLREEAGSGNRADVWLAVCGIVRDITGHDGPINRDTTFFPEHAG